jgi:Fe-Mn family superoxide dismutase
VSDHTIIKHNSVESLQTNEETINVNPSSSSPLSRRDFLKMAGMASGGLALAATQLGGGIAQACNPKLATPAAISDSAPLPDVITTIPTKDFSSLKERVSGISWNQLSQHIGLYEGYVSKLNKANATLAEAQVKNTGELDTRNLQHKRSYALNGALLHDWYFSNMGEDQPMMGALTQRLINRDFGSQTNYLADLGRVGKASRGWAITGLSLLDNRVYNYGLDAHDTGTPVWFHPLLVMDVYEHAYMIDFGTNKQLYMDAFTSAIRWDEVEKRAKQALLVQQTLNKAS